MLLINSQTAKEIQVTLPEIIADRVMPFTPMEINTAETTKTGREPAKENIATRMEIGMKAPLFAIKNMESVDLPPKKKDNTTVLNYLLRSMGKWSQTWRRHLRLPQQRLLFWMVAVRQKARRRNLYLLRNRNQTNWRMDRESVCQRQMDLPRWNLL